MAEVSKNDWASEAGSGEASRLLQVETEREDSERKAKLFAEQAPLLLLDLSEAVLSIAEKYNRSTGGTGDQLVIQDDSPNTIEIVRFPREVSALPQVEPGIWAMPEEKVAQFGPIVFLLNGCIPHYMPSGITVREKRDFSGYIRVSVGSLTLLQPRNMADPSGNPLVLPFTVRRARVILEPNWTITIRYLIGYGPSERKPDTEIVVIPLQEHEWNGAVEKVAERACKYVIEHRNSTSFFYKPTIGESEQVAMSKLIGSLFEELSRDDGANYGLSTHRLTVDDFQVVNDRNSRFSCWIEPGADSILNLEYRLDGKVITNALVIRAAENGEHEFRDENGRSWQVPMLVRRIRKTLQLGRLDDE